MEKFQTILDSIDSFVWGPVMLVLLVGTGIFLTIRTRALPWRNLGYAIRSTLSKEARQKSDAMGDVSPFAALMTALASTIGTGNIVGVATAMVSGGPGALVWMEISALFGLSTKFSECMLSVKYREKNDRGEITGGPMYTMKNGFKHKGLGKAFAIAFALFAAIASFGIGNLTQANSIASALNGTFGFGEKVVGVVLMVLALLILVGGIQSISKVASYVVPIMAIFYIIGGLIVIFGNIANIPVGVAMILKMAFSVKAVGGGLCGSIVASMMQAAQYGIARGCFSNEAGLGSAAITAASSTTDSPVKIGYVNMTGNFWDTIIVCTITGLCIASSGVLGTIDPATGEIYVGASLTMAAFSTVLGPVGNYVVCIGITLFAFSTILGWEYQGEKSFEFLVKTHKLNIVYRILFAVVVYFGATMSLDLAWTLSDIANALMAIPNLLCLLVLSKEIAKDMNDYQPTIKAEKAARKAAKKAKKYN